MRKVSASEKSDLTLIAALMFLLLLYLAYNTYVGKERPAPQDATKVVVEEKGPALTQL